MKEGEKERKKFIFYHAIITKAGRKRRGKKIIQHIKDIIVYLMQGDSPQSSKS